MKETLSRRELLKTGAAAALIFPASTHRAEAQTLTAPEEEITPERIGLPEFHKGTNVLAYHSDPENTGYEKRASETAKWLTDINTNSINYVYPIYQDNLWATEIKDGKDTPTQENMRTFIREMHNVGLPVTLRPSLDEASLMDENGNWRGTIQPNNPLEWFRSYTNRMVEDATLAEEEKADGFCVGLELTSMEWYTDDMIQMIHDVRDVFSGKITYSFNHNGSINPEDPGRIAIARELDETWIDAFFSLDVPQDASVEMVAEAWKEVIDYVKTYRDFTGNPIVFSEVGILSDYQRPFRWDSDLDPEATDEIQARYFQGICQNINEISGMHVWNAGFHEDTDSVSTDNIAFDVIGSPAEDVLRECYRNLDDEGNTTTE